MRRAALAVLAVSLAAGCAEEPQQREGAETADPVAEAPPVEPAPETSVVVELEGPDGSGAGSATLGPLLDAPRTRVGIQVAGVDAAEAAIHRGACGDLGEVAYELEAPADGTSTTVVDASLETIEGELPLAVAVRAGDGAVVACGDIS